MGYTNSTVQTSSGAARGGSGRMPESPCWVGIVIPVPEPMATELRRARASFGDPMASVIPAHITLVTTTPAPDWDSALEHVRAVTAAQAPFTVTLRGAASFRPVTPVVYVQVEDGFSECSQLHKELQSGPLDHENTYPYHPHVTVAHDVSEASMDNAVETLSDYSASFTVDRIGVFEHDPHGLWVLREEMRLRG
ncbi:2'-5' RNA ligase family protein [Arthrobacter koreensis]|jgi:2'-5' RNA ligase|uniref:2'-5' RNA ligase family protein n=1 Tax=Arthrobacter koreensis TaxID=199136 RepID=A0ABY6FUP4_9MICC|nr:2'-5' RNA ligase family protein [Arthrobacter koreensis]MDF2497149.1 putative 2-5 ligase [Arthrobacter koreensis]MEB7449264.1 2'-5' RNA ligase family protein [Arthrobacter koreensis]UYB36950.1 2'-5' RNA ligase family protein [Arthrobacter koreensis]